MSVRRQHRAVHLLTGKLFCGSCGGPAANARRGETERLILDALRDRLMAP